MDTKALEQKVRRLEVQNKNLSGKVAAQKLEVASKQKTLDAQERRWQESQVAVLAVRRGWIQLHEDLKDLAKTSGVTLDDESTVEEGNPLFDALVSALLRTKNQYELEQEAHEHADAAKGLAEETDLELKRVASHTNRLLGKILAEGSKVTTGGEADECVEIEELKGVNRSLKERVRIAEDKLMRKETELSDVQNLLADTQLSLENAQRKVLSFKSAPSSETSQAKMQMESAVISEKKKREDAKKKEEEDVADKEIQDKGVTHVIQTKVEELEKERLAHVQTKKELRLLELKMREEDWMCETRVYKDLMAEKNRLVDDLEKQKREKEQWQQLCQTKDLEIAEKSNIDPEKRCQAFEALKEAQKKVNELQKQIMKNEKAQQQPEMSTKSTLHASTVEEFNALIQKAQEETARVRRRLKESSSDGERVQQARNEAVEAAKRMRVAEDRHERLKEVVKDMEDSKKRMIMREAQLQEKKEDLGVFVEVLASCDIVDKQWKEAEARARERNASRENASLKRKIEELERVCGDEEGRKELETIRKRNSRLQSKVQQLHADLETAIRSKKHSEEDLTQQKQLNSALEDELEQTGTAYEETQTQSKKLLGQISEKDGTIVQLKSQIAKLTSRIGVLTSLVDNLEEKAKSSENDGKELLEIKEAFEQRIQEVSGETEELRQQVSQVQEKLNDSRFESARKEAARKDIESQLKASQRTSDKWKRTAEDEIEKHLNERSKRQKLEGDVQAYESLKKKLIAGTATKADFSNEHDIAVLNQEVESMRRCLNCSVCGTRPKSVVLLKCMHTFCKTCIDNRIETRSRRCPGCASAFSREDVRQFYLS